MVEPGSVVVVGSLNQDLVVRVSRHPVPGETVLGRDHFTGLGGKGANQAVAAARLGANVSMVGKVGDDAAGAEMVKGLEDVGVDTRGIGRDRARGSGLAVITVDDEAENAIVVSPGANEALAAADIDAAAGRLAEAAVVLAQLEVPLGTIVHAARLAGGRVILNPAPAPAGSLEPALLGAVDVLVPNRSELAILTGTPESADPEEVAAAVAGLDYVGDVVVTLGAAGALLVHDGVWTHFAAPEVEAVDTTGAGDAFCGALAAMLSSGAQIEDAVAWAVAAGAYAVTGMGAQGAMPTRDEVRALLDG